MWERITTNRSIPKNAKPMHLLWTLQFLFLYESGDVRATTLKADPKTIRDWVEAMLDAIMSLKKDVVRFNNFFL